MLIWGIYSLAILVLCTWSMAFNEKGTVGTRVVATIIVLPLLLFVIYHTAKALPWL